MEHEDPAAPASSPSSAAAAGYSAEGKTRRQLLAEIAAFKGGADIPTAERAGQEALAAEKDGGMGCAVALLVLGLLMGGATRERGGLIFAWVMAFAASLYLVGILLLARLRRMLECILDEYGIRGGRWRPRAHAPPPRADLPTPGPADPPGPGSRG